MAGWRRRSFGNVRPVRVDRYVLLESDFKTLTAVRQAGTRVILYESPLAPAVADRVDRSPSPLARDVRTRLAALCRAYDIECHPAPDLGPVEWSSWDHAPAGPLGRRIAEWIGSPP